MKHFSSLIQSLIILLLTISISVIGTAQPKGNDGPVQIDSTLFVVFGGGGNSGVVLGEKTVVVIDTKMTNASDSLYAFAKAKAGLKPIIVINTHYHRDHVRGNKFYHGSKIFIGSYEKDFLKDNIEPENQPTDFVKDSLLIDLSNEQVHLYNLGQAHTMNDVVVYLSKHRVLFTGDLIFNHINPVLMEKSGANVQRWISVLDILVQRWGNSTFVPGHGAIGDQTMAAALRQYFVDMSAASADTNRVHSMVEKYHDWIMMPTMASPEKTIEYIRASKPTVK
ncbi:MAG TPA: MBL fold metallo-hydrolase [Bacteroidota bacterium]|nr:MBL fold metallo-hydrolase [Bacteroidota bacterium]